MRILHVDIPLEPLAGRPAARRTLETSRAMVKAGTPCSILTTSQVMPEYVRRLEGSNVSLFRFLEDGVYYSKARRSRQLEQIIDPFDLVHIANHWSYLNALVYHACKKKGKPYVICPSGDTVKGNIGVGRFRSFFNALVGRNQIRRAAGHVAVTKDEFAWFKEYGVQSKDVTLIPNGVNPDDFKIPEDDRFRNRLGLGSAPFILFVGKLKDINGVDRLLDAYLAEVMEKGLSRYHLVFAGADGGLEDELKKKAELSGYGARIHFLGYLYREDMVRAYRAANLLVVPARKKTRSVAVLEAGICATPVLLTRDCDFSDLVEAGGAEVMWTSVEGIRKGLKDMCREWARLKRMGRDLQRYVLDYYTWGSVAEQYIELYERILDR